MESLQKVATSSASYDPFWSDSFRLSQNSIHIYVASFNSFFAGWTRFRGQIIVSLENSQLRASNHNIKQKQFSLQLHCTCNTLAALFFPIWRRILSVTARYNCFSVARSSQCICMRVHRDLLTLLQKRFLGVARNPLLERFGQPSLPNRLYKSYICRGGS